MQLDAYEKTQFGEPRRTAGRHGYVAYFPAPIPRSIEVPPSSIRALTDAEGALGRLAGIGELLPNPHLLIRPYLYREALSSSRIEGTQASYQDVIEVEATGEAPNADVEEVLNYAEALEWGLGQLDRLPLSLRLIRSIHKRLLAGVRGKERQPGELRRSQNWVGEPGSTIENARFVPPPPEELPELLTDWEKFAHERPEGLPHLLQNALLHYQFETLHPFLDGNGRLGRLLIVFMLISEGRLPAPLLYLSAYLERDRQRYYESLQSVREQGDLLPWFSLFLEAVESQAQDAVVRARRIVGLREQYRRRLSARSSNALAVVDLVCEFPIVYAKTIMDRIGVTRPTALNLLAQLESVQIVEEMPPGARGQRRFIARELLEVISSDPADD